MYEGELDEFSDVEETGQHLQRGYPVMPLDPVFHPLVDNDLDETAPPVLEPQGPYPNTYQLSELESLDDLNLDFLGVFDPNGMHIPTIPTKSDLRQEGRRVEYDNSPSPSSVSSLMASESFASFDVDADSGDEDYQPTHSKKAKTTHSNSAPEKKQAKPREKKPVRSAEANKRKGSNHSKPAEDATLSEQEEYARYREANNFAAAQSRQKRKEREQTVQHNYEAKCEQVMALEAQLKDMRSALAQNLAQFKDLESNVKLTVLSLESQNDLLSEQVVSLKCQNAFLVRELCASYHPSTNTIAEPLQAPQSVDSSALVNHTQTEEAEEVLLMGKLYAPKHVAQGQPKASDPVQLNTVKSGSSHQAKPIVQ